MIHGKTSFRSELDQKIENKTKRTNEELDQFNCAFERKAMILKFVDSIWYIIFCFCMCAHAKPSKERTEKIVNFLNFGLPVAHKLPHWSGQRRQLNSTTRSRANDQNYINRNRFHGQLEHMWNDQRAHTYLTHWTISSMVADEWTAFWAKQKKSKISESFTFIYD